MVDEDDEDSSAPPPARAQKGKGKGKAKKTKKPSRARRSFAHSDVEMGDEVDTGSEDDYVEDDDDEDISDFIVQSDEDEEKDVRRALKKRLGKKRMNTVFDSDDELETIEEKDVIFGVRKKARLSEEAIKLLPRFLPSTKMKVWFSNLMARIVLNHIV